MFVLNIRNMSIQDKHKLFNFLITEKIRRKAMTIKNIYRDRVLNEITEADVTSTVRVAGWVEFRLSIFVTCMVCFR